MSNPEVEIINCYECGEPIETRWADGRGGLLPVLIADWVFHPQCWEKIVERYPMDDSYTLLQDLVIPAGTKFYRAPNERGGDNAVEAVIGLGNDWTLNLNTPILGIEDAKGWLEKSS